MAASTPAELERRLTEYGQQHVLRWLDDLSARQRCELLAQLEQLDLPWLQRTLAADEQRPDPGSIEPYRKVIRPQRDPRRRAVRERGEQALAAGRVACLLVAGGQGTRLGFDGPKGAFPIGAVSGSTLFQLHAERLLALGRRYGVVPALYLMTSHSNHQATCALFRQHDNFGLPPDRVLLFQQGLAPAVDRQGKLLLAERHRLVLSPNGNGGLFAAMRDGGALEHMQRSGADVLSYIQVDNPLAQSCDPLFVGYHLEQGSHYSCKSIDKIGPKEKVGSFALVQGRLRIVEYFELPPQLTEQRGADGELLFGQSNPGLFLWSREFVETQAARRDLPYHRAHKAIEHIDEQGRRVRPPQPNGVKLESFAMDTLPDAPRSLVLWCERDLEFAPVKNAEGADSPASARRLMTRKFAGWLERAGVALPQDELQLEISPLYALDADELRQRLPAGFALTGERAGDLYLGPPR